MPFEVVFYEISAFGDGIGESMKTKFPNKNTTDVLEDEIDYCQKLVDVIEKEETLIQYPKVKEQLNLLKETVSDDIEHLQSSEVKMQKWVIKLPTHRFLDIRPILQ